MSDIKVTWDLPTKREPVATGVTLPPSEIKHTLVEILRPGQTTYAALATVLPNATETVTTNVPAGNYSFRLTVEDTAGRKSTPTVVTITVPATINAPGPVTNAKATLV